MYLRSNKLASKVWKKNCPNFLYTMYKAGTKLESFFHSLLAIFPLLVMHRKNAYTLLVCFNQVPYMQISTWSRTEYNQRKNERQQSYGVCECSETPTVVLGDKAL